MAPEVEPHSVSTAAVPVERLSQRVHRMAQFALPLDASVAVAGPVGEEHLQLGKLRTVRFPGDPAALAADDRELVVELERLRVEDIRYLLVPATSFEWLDSREELRARISDSCRLVVDEPETARVFALREVDDYSDQCRDLDGLPFPPVEMMRLTAGLFEKQGEEVCRAFHSQGQRAARWITDVLRKQGRDMAEFRSVFDFGCGCGRVIRQWKSVRGPGFHGSDFNEYLIGWASENLPFARFTINGDGPPLAYADESFDLIYALSVFTHFLEPVQRAWAGELSRVLEPGGLLMITTHGPQNVAELRPEGRTAFEEVDGPSRFEAGELVVIRPELAGTNACAAFHPEPYVRDVLAPAADCEVADYVPLGAVDAHQDVFVLRKS